MSFDPETLALWRDTDEVEIETTRGGEAPVHRTVIWIVGDADNAYVRSVRGPAGRWYRELRGNPHGAVHAQGKRVPVSAEFVDDLNTIAHVSDLIREKYDQKWPGPTASMVREEVLPTTLRLSPTS